MSNPEIIKELQEKNEKFELLLGQALEQLPKRTAKVVAGPMTEKNLMFYRVEENNQTFIVTNPGKDLFTGKNTKIEPGTEVMIVGSAIVAVMPETLHKPKEQVEEFELIDWAEVGGLKSQVQRIRETIELPLNNEKLFKEFGLHPIKGILLYGPPGCGKTLIAKAIASTILKKKAVPREAFIYVKGAELLDPYIGMTEKRIKAMFTQCRDYSKRTGSRGVIFIDEADALLPIRGSRRSSDIDKTIVPTFLSEMDGFDKHSPIMILATNLPDTLDPAILRDGRIDIKVEISRPTEEDAVDIFKIHLKKMKCAEDINTLSAVGTKYLYSNGLKHNVSGAMIENICATAGRTALTRAIADVKCKKGVIEADIHNSIESLKN